MCSICSCLSLTAFIVYTHSFNLPHVLHSLLTPILTNLPISHSSKSPLSPTCFFLSLPPTIPVCNPSMFRALSLPNNGLQTHDVVSLAQALKEDVVLTSLDLSHNKIGLEVIGKPHTCQYSSLFNTTHPPTNTTPPPDYPLFLSGALCSPPQDTPCWTTR